MSRNTGETVRVGKLRQVAEKWIERMEHNPSKHRKVVHAIVTGIVDLYREYGDGFGDYARHKSAMTLEEYWFQHFSDEKLEKLSQTLKKCRVCKK